MKPKYIAVLVFISLAAMGRFCEFAYGKNYSSLDEIYKAANDGNVEAQNYLGLLNLNGIYKGHSVPINHKEAFNCSKSPLCKDSLTLKKT